MAHSSDELSIARFTGRYLRFLETNLPDLPPEHPIRRELEAQAEILVGAYGLPPLGEADGYLAATEDELRDRLAQAELEPYVMPTDAQAAILLRGLPFSVDELTDAARSVVRLVLPYADAAQTEVIAGGCAAAGMIQGAIACAWSR